MARQPLVSLQLQPSYTGYVRHQFMFLVMPFGCFHQSMQEPFLGQVLLTERAAATLSNFYFLAGATTVFFDYVFEGPIQVAHF